MNKDEVLASWYHTVLSLYNTKFPLPLSDLKNWTRSSILDLMCPDLANLPPILLYYAKALNEEQQVLAIITYALYHYSYMRNCWHLHALLVAAQATLIEHSNEYFAFNGLSVFQVQDELMRLYQGAINYGVLIAEVRKYVTFVHLEPEY